MSGKLNYDFIRELEGRIVINTNIMKGYEENDPDYPGIDVGHYVSLSIENQAMRVALSGLYQKILEDTEDPNDHGEDVPDIKG